MVFADRTQTKNRSNIYSNVRDNKIVAGKPVETFNGHLQAEGSNILNYKKGELVYNKNCEWRFSGDSKFLRTKRGSTLWKDIVNASVGFGIFYKNDINYMVWVDSDGNLKYYTEDGDIVTLQTGMDTTYRHEFWFYGLSDNETLVGCNRTDGIYSITMPTTTPVYTSVDTTGAWSMSFSQISGRLIWTNGHKAYYGNIQNQTASDTTNLFTFDTDANWLWVNPDLGDGIQKVIDNGQITFYFKDTGIWALINAEEELENWLQPQCNADVGTKSPDTVRYCKYGKSEVFVYLGADKTLRLFTAEVERNSGATPTLTGGDSLIISKPFQKLLDDIPDGQLGKCTGYYTGSYYVLNIVSNGGSDIDTTIVIDFDKITAPKNDNEVAQPYWFYTDNMEYTHYAKMDNSRVYGIHKSGYIAELFVNDKYYEEVPARITPEQEFRDNLEIESVTGTFVKNESVIGSWTAKDSIRDWAGIAMSSDGVNQTAIVSSGNIRVSTDTGATWEAKDSARNWYDIAVSDDALYQVASDYGGKLYVSADTGDTWFAKDSDRNWTNVAISSDGSVIVALTYMGQIYVSVDTGTTFVAKDSDRYWSGISISKDGSIMMATEYGGYIYKSVDTGDSWSTTASARNWAGIVISEYGVTQTAVVDSGQIYVSLDTGATFVAKDSARVWSGLAMSANGAIQVATVYSGELYSSADYGNVWISYGSTRNWGGIALSSDGSVQTAIVSAGYLYTTPAGSGTTTLDVSDTSLLLNNLVGLFSAGDEIVGLTSGATATITTIVRRVTIEWSSYLGWQKQDNRELRLYDAYVNWTTDGNWGLNFSVNSFIFGETIPDYDQGTIFVIKPESSSGSYFNFDFFNVASFSSGSGQISQNSGGNGRGNYFSFGFYNNSYNEWATMYSIEPRFEVIKNSPIGRNN